MEKFRGDTFIFDLSIKKEDGSNYIFQSGDSVKCGMKKNIGDENYILENTKSVTESSEEVEFIFNSQTTKTIEEGDYILEFTLTADNIVNTVYQKVLKVRGVVNE